MKVELKVEIKVVWMVDPKEGVWVDLMAAEMAAEMAELSAISRAETRAV